MVEIAKLEPTSEVNVKRAVRLGLYGGLAAVFISAIGMVVVFNDRTIIDGLLSMGNLLLLLVPLLFGYMAAKPPPLLEGMAPPRKRAAQCG